MDSPSVRRELRIADARPFERGDHAVEFGDVGYGPDAYAIEFAARNPVAAHEHGAIAAATQLGCQAFGIGGIGKCPGLHEEGGGCDR